MMKALNKVIERYNCVHRRSIIEYDAQEIYEIAFSMLYDLEIEIPFRYNCKCISKDVFINIDYNDIDFLQCYGDINNITIVFPKNNIDLEQIYNSFRLGFQASLYCLLWDLSKDKTYKLNKHTYKNLEDRFNENSLEDLHDLATLLLNNHREYNSKLLGCYKLPIKPILYY